jgi:hypothetical protein
MVKSQNPVESVSKAAEDCRTPKAGAYSERPRDSGSSEHRPVRQAGILPAFSAHSQRPEIREPSWSAAVFAASKIRESVLECAGPPALCDRALLHIWDLNDTTLCLGVLWILHHSHVQFFLPFAECDVCCAITRSDLKHVEKLAFRR